jgi:hypothetical protein
MAKGMNINGTRIEINMTIPITCRLAALVRRPYNEERKMPADITPQKMQYHFCFSPKFQMHASPSIYSFSDCSISLLYGGIHFVVNKIKNLVLARRHSICYTRSLP